MASFSGFIRKSPTERLKRFFATRCVEFPEGFDWTATARGTAFVHSIEDLLLALPDLKGDGVKAELDLLASLADDKGKEAATQICAGDGMDLEGLEGIQDILLLLAVDHPRLLDRVNVQASLLRRSGGRQWARFQFPDDGKPWALDDPGSREAFLAEIVEILDLPSSRKREADWYKSGRTNFQTGEDKFLTQATIYIEERAESELAFKEETLERTIVPKVADVGIVCDPDDRMVEICVAGGRKVRDRCIETFVKHFAPNSQAPIEVPRRDVVLSTLRQGQDFLIEPADGIERVEVSSLSFKSSDGGFSRFEKRGDDETLYGFLNRRFGTASPLISGGWTILSVTLRIVVTQGEGKRPRTMTVTLGAPNTTTLPNTTEEDRAFVFALLERWKLLAPPITAAELFEKIA